MDILRGGRGKVLEGGTLWYPDIVYDGKKRRKTRSGLNKVVLLNICSVVSDPTSYNTLR